MGGTTRSGITLDLTVTVAALPLPRAHHRAGAVSVAVWRLLRADTFRTWRIDFLAPVTLFVGFARFHGFFFFRWALLVMRLILRVCSIFRAALFCRTAHVERNVFVMLFHFPS